MLDNVNFIVTEILKKVKDVNMLNHLKLAVLHQTAITSDINQHIGVQNVVLEILN